MAANHSLRTDVVLHLYSSNEKAHENKLRAVINVNGSAV